MILTFLIYMLMIQVDTLHALLSSGYNDVNNEDVEIDIALVDVVCLKHHLWSKKLLHEQPVC